MIKINQIVKTYGNIIALDHISTEIGTGEVVGLIGPNGAGKSTTMKIITGFLVPDHGDVFIDGINVNIDPVSCKKIIGYMPENNPLYKDSQVKDVIGLSLKLHNVPKHLWHERIDFVVEKIGISQVYYREINTLSKGFKQRVGLASVLVHNPKILILDEPTEGLDPNQRFEIRNLIKTLGKDKTIIVSTHVMQEIEAMCSRVILINKGRIALDKLSENLFDDLKKKDSSLEQLFREKTGKVVNLELKP